MKEETFNPKCKFGIEFEMLAADGKLKPEKGKDPAGIDKVALLIYNATGGDEVSIKSYEHTINNNDWVCKYDSSCGIEVCTPVLQGTGDLAKVVKVTEAFGRSNDVNVDEKCSVHIHVGISDYNTAQIASILKFFIQSELVFLDSVPEDRKCNKYCFSIGLRVMVEDNSVLTPEQLLNTISVTKYNPLNIRQYIVDGRKSIEFRIAEGKMVKDPFGMKCWSKLIMYCFHIASQIKYNVSFDEKDPTSGFQWLDPIDTFDILRLTPGKFSLSPGLKQVRDWFLARLQKNVSEHEFRSKAKKEIYELIKMAERFDGSVINENTLKLKDFTEEDLYGKIYNY